jgi:hypothetical protein
VFGPILGIPKEWVTADDRTLIHFNEKTTEKVQVCRHLEGRVTRGQC